MKVLVIEDEPQALEGMKRIMDQLDVSVQQSFFCNCAAEALEVIDEFRPELIVTDIILPDLTGLDLLERIQIENYEPKVIIVSGFDDFEYAKRGLKLGAIDYFLKPFDTEQFSQKLKECIAWIAEEQQEQLDHHRALELAHLGTRSMREVFLSGICLQPSYLQEHIVHRLQTWGLEWMAAKPYHVIALTVKVSTEDISEQEEETLSFATGNIVEELLVSYAPSVTFRNAKKYWIIISSLDDIGPLLDTLRREILNYQKLKACFGVSDRMSSFQALHTAYRQAVDCLRSALMSRDQELYYFDQLKAHSVSSEEEITAYMITSIVTRDDEGMGEAADLFVRNLVMKGKATRPSDISQRSLDWVVELQEELRKNTHLSINEIPVALWDEMDECESMDDLSQVLARYLQSVSLLLKGINRNGIIEQAMKLIHESSLEELKLQTLADELSMHPVWLSQLFKKEVGMNFLDYVTELRIQKAKELLRQTNMKIYEISTAVGYQDIHYFGRLFKKKTGATPKDFRHGKC